MWGTSSDRRAAAFAGILALVMVTAYTVIARSFAPAIAPTRLEIAGTWSSLACVWLTRRQNVLSIPYGVVSVVAMGIYFFDVELVGKGWLHLGYYVPVQIIGWWVWIRAGDGRTDLPVGWLSWPARVLLVILVLAGTFVLAEVFERVHGPGPYLLWDASIVAASVVAQPLLITKRIESWWLWLIPIDVSAIVLYLRTDAEMFAALYAAYVVIASLGLHEWWRAWRAQQIGLSAFEARQPEVRGLPSSGVTRWS